jgi:serine/threonine protein kinase
VTKIHDDSTSENENVRDVDDDDQTTQAVSQMAEPIANKKKKSKKCRYVVKLADVEFASMSITPEHMKSLETPPNWLAPELLSNKASVSPASDVFALGNVMYEIAYRQIPWEEEGKPRSNGEIRQQILSGNLPPFHHHHHSNNSKNHNNNNNSHEDDDEEDDNAVEENSRSRLDSLMIKCMAMIPEDRPTVFEVEAEISHEMDTYKQIMESMQKRKTFVGTEV